MKQYIITFIILFSGIYMQAQTTKNDSLQRVMTLEKEYNPDIDKAPKINVLPEIKEPEAPKSKIEYSNYETLPNVRPEASRLQPGRYFESLNGSKKKGYAVLGVSTFPDVDADLGYQLLNTSEDELSFWVSHRSSWGKVKSLQSPDEKMKVKLNDNVGGISYGHNFKSMKLAADARYMYSGFNYYGIMPLVSAPQENINTPDQGNNLLDVNAGLSSEREEGFSWLFGLGYTYFGQKNNTYNDQKGLEENEFKANMAIYTSFDDNKQIGFAGYFRTDSYSIPFDGAFAYKSYGDINLNPYFKMTGDNWNTRIGVQAHVLLDHAKDIFIVPEFDFSYRPVETLSLYLTTKGGVADNSNNRIFHENRYVAPETRVQDSYSMFDAELGAKTSWGGVFEAALFAGYKYTEDEHFYVNSASSVYSPHLTNYGNILLPQYSDVNVFKLGTNLKYQFRDVFHAELKAAYYQWNVEGEQKAWYKPEFESDLTAGFLVPGIPLKMDLAYHLEAGRKCYPGAPLKMKNINDVSLTETYTFSEMISVFGRIDNLFAQQYDIWYGYPAEGLRLMLGVNVKF